MENYSAIIRKKILIHFMTWINLEDIMPDELSQSQKGKNLYDSTYMIYLQFLNS